MAKIEAAQFVYFRADSSLPWISSPGFQTVAASSGLPRDLIKQEIEPRLYMDPNTTSHQKVVYFLTSDGRAVISRATRAEGTGSDQRLGHYFQHGVVLQPDDFLKCDCDPSRVWPQVDFLLTAAQAMTNYKAFQGEMPTVLLDSRPRSIEADRELPEGWDSETWNTAISLALASESIDRLNPLCAIGPLDPILVFIQQMYARMSAQMRAQCFFDTDFTAMQGHALPNWLIGYPQSPNLRGRNIVDLHQRQVSFVRKSLEKTSLYQAWQSRTNFSSAKHRTDASCQVPEVVWQVSRIVEGVDRETDPQQLYLKSADEIEQLWQNNQPIVWSAYKESLSRILASELVNRCGESLCELQDPSKRLASIQGSWDIGLIIDCLWAAYAQENINLIPAENDQLRELIEANPEANCLAVWWLLFNQKYREFAPFLENLIPQQYAQFVEIAIRRPGVPIHELLVEKHASIFKEVADRLGAVTLENIQPLQNTCDQLGLQELYGEWHRRLGINKSKSVVRNSVPSAIKTASTDSRVPDRPSRARQTSLGARTTAAILKFFRGQ